MALMAKSDVFFLGLLRTSRTKKHVTKVVRSLCNLPVCWKKNLDFFYSEWLLPKKCLRAIFKIFKILCSSLLNNLPDWKFSDKVFLSFFYSKRLSSCKNTTSLFHSITASQHRSIFMTHRAKLWHTKLHSEDHCFIKAIVALITHLQPVHQDRHLPMTHSHLQTNVNTQT